MRKLLNSIFALFFADIVAKATWVKESKEVALKKLRESAIIKVYTINVIVNRFLVGLVSRIT